MMHLVYYSSVFLFLSSLLRRSPMPLLSSRCLTTLHCLPTVLTPHLRPLCYLSTVFQSTLTPPYSHFYLAFFLSDDTELNPGPSYFTVCMLNICSVFHPVYSAALSDIIYTHSPDLFCLTETWIKPSTVRLPLSSYLYRTELVIAQ